MSITRNNHYVPQWYQEGFFEPGKTTLAYLDLNPNQRVLDDGRIITERALFDAPTSRAFCQRDLYSTFFGTSINDEIERRLFGDIDGRGSSAVRAFVSTDVSEWHRHFQTLFEYIDIQKIRTPKGLDWLKSQYPDLSQNELMSEMQGIRSMHCTIWSEAVREIVSAENSTVKFVLSDHPITLYNYAAPPHAVPCAYPNDPAISWKASQTIFPLSRNLCLILTNLEYARDPSTPPLDKRTFARNYRQSMVRTDAFIRTRNLSNLEVSRVNYIIKSRARRFLAAGRREWLYPEEEVSESWEELRSTLLPPESGVWQFGGEVYAKFESGHVHYQDEFGRTEKQRDFLKKDSQKTELLQHHDQCGCGSGRIFADCCLGKPLLRRPSWIQRSIRERNMMLLNAIVNVLELHDGRDWTSVRRALTDDQIATVYEVYSNLWPLETDLLELLPKPDGLPRAIYTGHIHPDVITDVALGCCLYFGELIVEHPFVHAGTLRKDFSPVDNPRLYRQEFLKAVVFFLKVMPLVECGAINLIPDPCNFSTHLRDQMMRMAEARSPLLDPDRREPQIEKLMQEDFKRTILSLPKEALRSQLRKAANLDDAGLEEMLPYIDTIREQDPLAVLQDNSLTGGKEGGQLNLLKLAPNFEMAMYLAQATGSCIVTDSAARWDEVKRAFRHRAGSPSLHLAALAHSIQSSRFAFPQLATDIDGMRSMTTFSAYRILMRDAFRYLSNVGIKGPKPNWEAHLNARFLKAHKLGQKTISDFKVRTTMAKVSCIFPPGGIQDNTINRLLLMSSSEMHLPSVPMAFFIDKHTSISSAG